MEDKDCLFSQNWPSAEKRWVALMRYFDYPLNLDTFDALSSAYRDVHRHYHNFEHVRQCISWFDSLRPLATHPGEVELALWFHDAVYSPLGRTNEADSAMWAGDFLIRNGASIDSISRVKKLILATAHHTNQPASQDEALLLDIDLAILGATGPAYKSYERAIRKEYAEVPMVLYRHGRRKLLKSLLKRENIYHTYEMGLKLEEAARKNITSSLHSRPHHAIIGKLRRKPSPD